MAKETIGELFRRGDYYLVKRIREVIGQMQGSGFGPETEYMITLYDTSNGRLRYYDSDIWEGVYAATLEAEDGDIILMPAMSTDWSLDLQDSGNDPAVAIVGISRTNSKLETEWGSLWVTGASIENMTYNRSSSSSNPLAVIEYGQEQTAWVIKATVSSTNTGTGDAHGLEVGDAGFANTVMEVLSSIVEGNATGGGNGYAVKCDEDATVNLYHSHVKYSTAATNGTGTVNMYGCLVESL